MKLKEKFNKKDGQNKKEKKPLKQRIRESMNGKYLRNGSYSVMISAIFIVIVIVINMIIGSLPSKYTEFDVSHRSCTASVMRRNHTLRNWIRTSRSIRLSRVVPRTKP